MNPLEDKDLSKKEKILQATLESMKNDGFEGLTVRQIASRAHVNVALVNYYFGSKDKLLNEAIQVLVNSLRESFTILDNNAMDPRERLEQFLIQYVSAHCKYPFIVHRLLTGEPFIFESQKEFFQFIKAIGLKKMQATVSELTGESNPKVLTIMVSQLLGAVFLPPLVEPLYETITGYPFSDCKTQIRILLDRYFSN